MNVLLEKLSSIFLLVFTSTKFVYKPLMTQLQTERLHGKLYPCYKTQITLHFAKKKKKK